MASGCGGEDSPDQDATLSAAQYQAAIIGILDRSREAHSLYFDLTADRRSAATCAELMEDFDREVSQLIGQAAELRPPEEVAAIHAEFVAAAERSVERVGEIVSRVAMREVLCGRELNDLLYGMPSTEEAEDAISRIEDHGYVVFGR